MPRLAWVTDLHLNFVTEDQIVQLAEAIRAGDPQLLLIGGDLGEASSWESYLFQLDQLLKIPIYFVLGNHDYYAGSLEDVRQRALQISQTSARLHWLPASGVVSLHSETALVGHGGWGDARTGSFHHSRVLLNDYFLIEELRTAAGIPEGTSNWWGEPAFILNEGLSSQLQELGDETARHFREVIPSALADHQHVIVLMHVPPFREACWHEGHVADDNWAPHFCCVAAGEALKDIMRQHPQHRMTVLCGHTHGAGRAEILPNLIVHTGAAEYGEPALQTIIDTATM